MELYWLYLAKGPFNPMPICCKLSAPSSTSALGTVQGREKRISQYSPKVHCILVGRDLIGCGKDAIGGCHRRNKKEVKCQIASHNKNR